MGYATQNQGKTVRAQACGLARNVTRLEAGLNNLEFVSPILTRMATYNTRMHENLIFKARVDKDAADICYLPLESRSILSNMIRK